MFKVNRVNSCPVSRASMGVITFTPEHIGMIAGAARHKLEWALLLHGERSADGFEVTVTDFTVPPQYRGSADVELPEMDLAADVVGVMHLHPWWSSPHFSGIDRDTLNPRFPSSVVVSPSTNSLGFAWEAVGKVTLPCKALGQVDFEVAVEGVERFAAEPVRATHGLENEVKGCEHWQWVDGSDEWTGKIATDCGLVGLDTEKPTVFGLNGDDLLAEVEKQTLRKLITSGKGKNSKNGNGGNGKGNRNGLVKLDRPKNALDQVGSFSDNKTGDQFISGNCDGIGCDGKGVLLKFYRPTRDFLCSDCYAYYTGREDRAKSWERIIDDGDDEVVIRISGDGKEESYSLVKNRNGVYTPRSM